jgi:uncharacterized protein YprB with RNaseH-like and TPR domain
MRDLAARLRSIVKQDAERANPTAAPIRELTYVPDIDGARDVERTAADLGGSVHRTSHGSCVKVDRVWAAAERHGRKAMAECLIDDAAPIALFDPRLSTHSSWANRVVFFDIETTGLSGGAGTLAFLVGCGWFEGEDFRVRQFFLSGPNDERPMLDALSEIFADASLLVTYNGRAFDVPVMEMRWAFHRLAPPTDDLPHFDMLAPARRLWGEGECTLSALERSLAGVHRLGDVAGFEIPTRYFQFLRTGDPGAVEGVLAHNRHDVASLAVITSHALALARGGPEACQSAEEQLALARMYERANDEERAAKAYELASNADDRGIKRQALAGLAVLRRRAHRYDEAAAAWQDVLALSVPDESTPLGRRAAEALAIHHEHRAHDLIAARRYAEALGADGSGRAADEARHRLGRLDRKLANRAKREDAGLLTPDV